MSFFSSRAWKFFRGAFRVLRLTMLLLLCVSSVQLVIWNRNYDPRFYRFLSTPPGMALARLMRWPNFYNPQLQDKDLEDYSDDERAVYLRLERELRQTWPTHRLTLKDGTEHLGTLLSYSQGALQFREYFGSEGVLEKVIPREDIAGLTEYREPIPEISWRDVRLQMEYPKFNLTRFGHYTILTDAPYFQVADSVRELEALYQQYQEIFRTLIRFPRKDQGLQVIFFANEEQYRSHQARAAPALSDSAGYYSPLEDRMVVFNQAHSQRSRELREDVEAQLQRLMQDVNSPLQRRQIEQMRADVQRQMREQGQRETVATLRHEGAHHLSYALGVHSWIHTENAWLIEGLAVYFETEPPGEVAFSNLNTLIRLHGQGRIPPLVDLIRIRQPEEFSSALPGIEPYEAYALSWSLVHFGMTRHRDGFFRYLQELQNPPRLGEWVARPREALLAEALGLSPMALEEGWRQHLRELGVFSPLDGRDG